MDYLTATGPRLILAAAVPLIAAGILFIAGRSAGKIFTVMVSFAAAAAAAACVWSLVPLALAGEDVSTVLYGSADGIVMMLRADSAGIACASAACLIALPAVFFRAGVASAKDHGASHPAAVPFFLSGAVGTCLAGDIISFTAFTLIAAVSARMIAGAVSGSGTRSKRVMDVFTAACCVLLTAGAYLICALTGRSGFVQGGFVSGDVMSAQAAALLLVILAVSGIPGAGAFSAFRMVLFVFGTDLSAVCGGSDALVWTCALLALIAAVSSFKVEDIGSRIGLIAFSQALIVSAGMSLRAPLGIAGGVFSAASQLLVLELLTMSAYTVTVKPAETAEQESAGSGRRSYEYAIVFGIAAAAAACTPFMAGFPGMAAMLYGSVQAGRPVMTAAVIAVCVATAASLMSAVIRITRKTDSDVSIMTRTGAVLIIPEILVLVMIILLGTAPNAFLDLFELAVRAGDSIFTPLM